MKQKKIKTTSNVEKTWEEVTKPLREDVKKAGMKEEEAVDIVHRFRQNK